MFYSDVPYGVEVLEGLFYTTLKVTIIISILFSFYYHGNYYGFYYLYHRHHNHFIIIIVLSFIFSFATVNSCYTCINNT